MRANFLTFIRILLLCLYLFTATLSQVSAQLSKINEVKLNAQVDSLFQMEKVPTNFAFAKTLKTISQTIDSVHLEGEISQWIGKYHRKQEAYALAIAAFFESQHIGNEISDSLLICLSNFELGATYLTMNNTEKALTYLAISLQQAKTIHHKKVEGFILNEYGILYIKKGDFKKALSYLVPAKAIVQSTKDSTNILSIDNNLGIAYTLTGKPAKGLAIFFERYHSYKAHKDSLSYASGHGNIAFAYQKMGKMKAALMHYDSSIYYATKYHQNKVASISYQDLSGAYMAMGNTSRAFDAFQKYHQLEKIAISETTQQSISKLEVAFETAKKERELKLAQNQIKALDYLAQIRLQRIFIISSGLIILCILVVILYARQKSILKRRRIEEKLVIAELESKRLEAEALTQKIMHKNTDLTSLALSIEQQKDFHTNIVQQMKALLPKLPPKLKEQMLEIIKYSDAHLAINNKNYSQQKNIKKVTHIFFKKLEEKHGKLTPNEKYLAGSFRLGFSNKEIASQKDVSVNAIKMGRHRLRKKLQLDEAQDLIRYLQRI